LRDEAGAALVEMSLVIVLLLLQTLGFVDFGYALYQWKAASKAVQIGARLASVSQSVAIGLDSEAGKPANSDDVGAAVPANRYHYTCDYSVGNTLSCTCTGTCAGTGFRQSALDLLFNGDAGRPGMRTFMPALLEREIKVEYVATGLGYWTRPGGAVPTIRVSIVNHPFQFFFIAALLNLTNSSITMPNMLSTVTGEDLKTTSP